MAEEAAVADIYVGGEMVAQVDNGHDLLGCTGRAIDNKQMIFAN